MIIHMKYTHKHIHINIILWWTGIINFSISVYFSLLKITLFYFIFLKALRHRAQWFVFNKTADSRLISKFIVAFTKCTTRRISILFFCCCCWLLLLGKCACISKKQKKQKKKKKKLREFIFRKFVLFCSMNVFETCAVSTFLFSRLLNINSSSTMW